MRLSVLLFTLCPLVFGNSLEIMDVGGMCYIYSNSTRGCTGSSEVIAVLNGTSCSSKYNYIQISYGAIPLTVTRSQHDRAQRAHRDKCRQCDCLWSPPTSWSRACLDHSRQERSSQVSKHRRRHSKLYNRQRVHGGDFLLCP